MREKEKAKRVPRGFDVTVVGGGPAGLVAAYHAARGGARTLLLDRNHRLGEKILLSGGGRCNVLPTEVDPASYTTDSSRNTLKKILLSWPLAEVRAFLEGPIGLRLVEEKKTGKVFPLFGGGEGVRDGLLAAAKRAGAKVRTDALVTEVHPSERRRVRIESGEGIVTHRVILATGGLSYPETGSDGAGFAVARSLGHQVVPPYPALVALRSRGKRFHLLSGLCLPVLLTVGEGKGRVRAEGDFLFTHRGFSGPVVLGLAHHAARAELLGLRPAITVCWGPRRVEEWEDLLASHPTRTVRGVLKEALPGRLVDALLLEIGLFEAKVTALSKAERARVLQALTAFPLPWTRTEGFAAAEATGGGVPLSEVNPETLESRIAPRIHLCGEVLDAFGPIGGNNFLWAFVTGRLAGEGASS